MNADALFKKLIKSSYAECIQSSIKKAAILNPRKRLATIVSDVMQHHE